MYTFPNFEPASWFMSSSSSASWPAYRFLMRQVRCANIPISLRIFHSLLWSTQDNSIGKESACKAGDPSSIPGLERSTGEGTGYPLQYSWASLVAQPVKNLPTMRETWVESLGWEDPLEKWKANYSSRLAWRIPCVHGVANSRTWLSDFHSLHTVKVFSIVSEAEVEVFRIPLLSLWPNRCWQFDL